MQAICYNINIFAEGVNQYKGCGLWSHKNMAILQGQICLSVPSCTSVTGSSMNSSQVNLNTASSLMPGTFQHILFPILRMLFLCPKMSFLIFKTLKQLILHTLFAIRINFPFLSLYLSQFVILYLCAYILITCIPHQNMSSIREPTMILVYQC